MFNFSIVWNIKDRMAYKFSSASLWACENFLSFFFFSFRKKKSFCWGTGEGGWVCGIVHFLEDSCFNVSTKLALQLCYWICDLLEFLDGPIV